MTVRYADAIPKNSKLGAFSKLIFMWKGSVLKFVWREYLVFITLFFSISLVYRLALNDEEKRYFEKLANFCEKSKEAFRLYFVLGFFVSSIISNFWRSYDSIPFADPVGHYVYACIRGHDKDTEDLREKIVRLSCLSVILTLVAISPTLKEEFPQTKLIALKALTDEENTRLEEMKKKNENKLNVLPIVWATELVVKTFEEKKIQTFTESGCFKICDQLDKLRSACSSLLEYERFSVPLAYIQVVAVSVYTYFFSCLLGSQWLERNSRLMDLDLYFPFSTTIEFFIYMGWLKVATSMINPFGCYDGDIELETLVVANRLSIGFYCKVTCYKTEHECSDHTHNDNGDTKTEVTHHFNNETVNNYNTEDPERIPLSALAEADVEMNAPEVMVFSGLSSHMLD